MNKQDLEKINNLSRRKLTEEEVFAFSVVLCDNEVDRDYECFSVGALQKLAEMYIGKSGIFDHSMKGKDQVARIFDTMVEAVPGKQTKQGEPYYRLVAKAYIPRAEKNRALIEDIEYGLKKEVSVGCSMKEAICSVCKESIRTQSCRHQKGNRYGDQLCYTILEEPEDAYEWSFVAVPAQVAAGVMKAYRQEQRGGNATVQQVIKALGEGETLLSAEEAVGLSRYIHMLEIQAQEGKAYETQLQKDVVKYGMIALPELNGTQLETMSQKLNITELKAMKEALRKKAGQVFPMVQLGREKEVNSSDVNQEFQI